MSAEYRLSEKVRVLRNGSGPPDPGARPTIVRTEPGQILTEAAIRPSCSVLWRRVGFQRPDSYWAESSSSTASAARRDAPGLPSFARMRA